MSVFEYARREQLSAATYERERRRALRERTRDVARTRAYVEFLSSYDYERFIADGRIGPRVAFQLKEAS